MTKQSVTDNLKDFIRILGGTPKGNTNAELLDELEGIMSIGGATPEQVEAAVGSYIEDNHGALDDDELDSIFED